MTQEFKNNVLKYLTGQLDIETGSNVPQINQIIEVENDLDTFIRQYYPGLSTIWSINQLISRGDYIIAWISDYNNNISDPNYGKWKKSLIVVMDRNYTPLHYVDTYSSGTPLGNLFRVNSEDNGTGNIIGVEIVFDSNGNIVNRRITMINDFTLTNFEVKLLNSFNIPQYNGYNLNISQITKNPNAGKYFLIYSYNNTGGTDFGGALEFVNNVGTENEWNFYPYTGSRNINWYGFMRGTPNWNNDTLGFRMFVDYDITMDARGNTTEFAVLKESVVNDVRTTIEERTIALPLTCKNVGQMLGLEVMGNYALVDTTTTLSTQSQTKYIIQFNMNDGSYVIRYANENYPGTTLPGTGNYTASYDDIDLLTINGQFYFFRHYVYYRTENFQTVEYYDNTLYLDQIFNDNVYEFDIKDFDQQSANNYNIYKSNTYNLWEFGVILPTYVIKIKQIFNQLNYNGLPYTNINAMVPNSATILDNSGVVIFARNLYNKIVNNNMTQATVEIPNNFLNDVSITYENLLGETNKVLNASNVNITTNIYEALLINWYNTLTMKNSNNPQNEIINQPGAIRLNESVSENIDYTDCQATKIKVYQSDNTTYIRQLLDSEISNADNLSIYEFKIIVNTGVSINRIDIISVDENTTYQVIDNINLESGKLYNIQQTVEIL
jgi:hypothetical protein